MYVDDTVQNKVDGAVPLVQKLI